MEYGGIRIIKSILPVDFSGMISLFFQKKGATKMLLLPKSKLVIFNVDEIL